MFQIIDKETLLADRRKGNFEQVLEYRSPTGEMKTVTAKIVNGEMETFELNTNGQAIGEMMTTPANLDGLVQKTVLDLQVGREQIPLLYKPIYSYIENRNFPQFVSTKPLQNVQIVFLEKLEGQEIVFGTRKIGTSDTIPIITYAAGLEWTEDMVEYDSSWEMEMGSRSMGEAFNALLNHLHLNPILAFAYAAKNKTAADATGATYTEKVRNTILNGLDHARADKNTDTNRVRNPRVLLAHPSKKRAITEALARQVINGTEYQAIDDIDTLIFYDGWSGQVGEKTYTYGGVNPARAYLIEPKSYFWELVKHDLRIDAGNGDLSRLIESQEVARFRRGVFASVANAVEELTLP